jgi:hypothetical protein
MADRKWIRWVPPIARAVHAGRMPCMRAATRKKVFVTDIFVSMFWASRVAKMSPIESRRFPQSPVASHSLSE